MTRVARFVRGLVVAAAVLASLDAQEPPAQFRGRTDLVTLDVTVLDRDRRPVRGLTAEDFVIVDGGSSLPVTGFAAIDLPGATTRSTDVDAVTPDVATNAPADGRLITIMFDHSIPAGWGAQAARRVAHSIVEQLGPNDRGAIVFSDRTLSQSFTNDRVRLGSVIDNRSVGTTLAQAIRDEKGNSVPVDTTGRCPCGLCSLETIATVADSVADVSNRRKVLVFIGGYLPLNPAAWGSKDSPCQPRLPPAIAQTLRAAQRANLTIYAFDPHGLVTPRQGGRLVAGGIDINDPQSAARDIETLLAAADHTGGRAIVNTNAPEERVVEVFEETGAYYLLGFEPPADAAAGSFRNVTVRVNRPGVDVLTRRGYYVPGAANAVTTDGDADPLMAAIRSLLPQATMPMQLSLAAFPGPDGASTLAVTTTIEREDAAPLELLAAAFDRTGQLVASARHTVSPDAGASLTGTDEVFTRLALPRSGGYHVRVAARDTATGRIASVHDIAEVPAFARDRLSLSGLVVQTARVSQRSIWALTDFLPVVPTTRRTFARDETVTVYAQVAQVDSPTVVRMTARVFDGNGQALLERGEAIDVATFIAGPTFYRLDLPLVRLTPGTYLLNVEAARDTDRVSRTMHFQVQ
ncbi:MAG: VWA domain-containing protein [Acidobacteria bacterium]|nr:VWA domain-containing protein [Acidobacteriota bacterium]